MIKLKPMRIFLVIFLSIFPLLSSQAGDLLLEDAKAYREAGYKAQSLGDIEGALVWYQKAAQLDPNYAQVHNDIGVIFENQGDLVRAEKMYKKTLSIDSNFLPAYTNLAFIAEKKGNVEDANYYWTKRYELGQKGDYWWEVARQHLLKLGTYPKLRRERLEKQASLLSKEVAQNNERERLVLVKEAKLHFDIANQAFLEKDYETAIKEFETVFLLNSPDKELIDKSVSIYKQSKRLFLRKKALSDAKNALDYIENDDYLSAEKKLGDTLETISRIAQEK